MDVHSLKFTCLLILLLLFLLLENLNRLNFFLNHVKILGWVVSLWVWEKRLIYDDFTRVWVSNLFLFLGVRLWVVLLCNQIGLREWFLYRSNFSLWNWLVLGGMNAIEICQTWHIVKWLEVIWFLDGPRTMFYVLTWSDPGIILNLLDGVWGVSVTICFKLRNRNRLICLILIHCW